MTNDLHVLVVNAVAHFTNPVPKRAIIQRLRELGHEPDSYLVWREMQVARKMGSIRSIGRTRATKWVLN